MKPPGLSGIGEGGRCLAELKLGLVFFLSEGQYLLAGRLRHFSTHGGFLLHFGLILERPFGAVVAAVAPLGPNLASNPGLVATFCGNSIIHSCVPSSSPPSYMSEKMIMLSLPPPIRCDVAVMTLETWRLNFFERSFFTIFTLFSLS